jgi:hypothetical protein
MYNSRDFQGGSAGSGNFNLAGYAPFWNRSKLVVAAALILALGLLLLLSLTVPGRAAGLTDCRHYRPI